MQNKNTFRWTVLSSNKEALLVTRGWQRNRKGGPLDPVQMRSSYVMTARHTVAAATGLHLIFHISSLVLRTTIATARLHQLSWVWHATGRMCLWRQHLSDSSNQTYHKWMATTIPILEILLEQRAPLIKFMGHREVYQPPLNHRPEPETPTIGTHAWWILRPGTHMGIFQIFIFFFLFLVSTFARWVQQGACYSTLVNQANAIVNLVQSSMGNK